MSPPGDDERRPVRGSGGHDVGETVTDIVPRHGDEMPRTEAKAGGIIRVNRARDVTATCECGARFTSTGPAASHARSARHRVEVAYTSVFVFVPGESLTEAPRWSR